MKIIKDHKDGKYGPFGNTPLLHELTLHCGMVVGISTLLKPLIPKLLSVVKLQPIWSFKKWEKKTKNFKQKNNFNKIKKHNTM